MLRPSVLSRKLTSLYSCTMGPFTREPSVPQEVMEKIEKHSMEKTSQVQDNAVGVGEDIVISSSPTMAGVFSKKALIFGWASLLAVALTNYLDLVAVNTFQVYAMSEFNRLSIEGALTTAIGVATIGEKAWLLRAFMC